MNCIVLLILAMILTNSAFTLIPTFYPDSDPGLYLPYQFWINILLIFNCVLPSRKGSYLFDDIGKQIPIANAVEMVKQFDDSTPSAPPPLSVDSTPSAPPPLSVDSTPSAPPLSVDSTPSAPPLSVDSNVSSINNSGLTTELNPDGSFPSNYDIYSSRADS